ncbi:hypothetical protein AGLY_000441 [Aphis glycines]|uniref:Uncharacterized protein n=1 Tax=Aphis glycines TaxID=307491 RepID=A0A6G0U701_APHGL|nr:hypothetical protein AGLY_000441 [Aphis glycines]
MDKQTNRQNSFHSFIIMFIQIIFQVKNSFPLQNILNKHVSFILYYHERSSSVPPLDITNIVTQSNVSVYSAYGIKKLICLTRNRKMLQNSYCTNLKHSQISLNGYDTLLTVAKAISNFKIKKFISIDLSSKLLIRWKYQLYVNNVYIQLCINAWFYPHFKCDIRVLNLNNITTQKTE